MRMLVNKRKGITAESQQTLRHKRTMKVMSDMQLIHSSFDSLIPTRESGLTYI